jgi:tryptophanyl-tRNA synthetase
MKRIFSGIQPTNNIHIGNYIGAIQQFVKLQDEFDCVFSIVDLHAITIPQDPEDLRQNVLNLSAMYLAAGIDPKKSILFQQSRVSEHSELGWVLTTITRMGELERMTQYKEKGRGKHDTVGVGLFSYPILMAADILLYNTDVVPVGDDQKQHVELSRDLAERFNRDFGQTFKVPEVRIRKKGARIMGLDDPTKKMSKSASSAKNYISMTDDDATITKKIKSAVTDSEGTIKYDPKRPGVYNLITIFCAVTDKTPDQIEDDYKDKGYADFKSDLAEAVVAFVSPIRERHAELLEDEDMLKAILDDGAERAQDIASKKIEEVKERVGINL